MAALEPRVLLADHVARETVDAYRSLPSAAGLALAAPSGPALEHLLAVLPEADFLLVRRRPLTGAMAARAARLRAVVAVGQRVPIDPAFERAGVRLEYRPRYTAHAVADLVLGLMLGLSRDLVSAHRGVAGGAYSERGLTPRPTSETQVAFNWLDLRDEGPLFGKTLGLVGFGEIGTLVAARARAFGMTVRYYRRAALAESDERALGVTYRPLEVMLAESDFVSVQVPDTPETRGLLNRERLELLRPTAYLINTSRGHVLDEAALAEFLAAGRIAGAGLDVFQEEPLPADSPLTRLPNVMLTPHIGGGGSRTLRGEMDAAFGRILALWRGSSS